MKALIEQLYQSNEIGEETKDKLMKKLFDTYITPGRGNLANLNVPTIPSQSIESLIKRHKTKLSSEFTSHNNEDMYDDVEDTEYDSISSPKKDKPYIDDDYDY